MSSSSHEQIYKISINEKHHTRLRKVLKQSIVSVGNFAESDKREFERGAWNFARGTTIMTLNLKTWLNI